VYKRAESASASSSAASMAKRKGGPAKSTRNVGVYGQWNVHPRSSVVRTVRV
jgi:hypothetical protein